MQIEELTVGEVAIVRFIGEITQQKGNAPMRTAVSDLVQRGRTKVLFDLGGVSYIDSAGLGELVHSHATVKNHGGSLKLLNPTSRLRELLVVTRLSTVLRSY